MKIFSKGPLPAIFWGGLLASVLDLTQAFIGFSLMGSTPFRILQRIAGGLFGTHSRDMGWASARVLVPNYRLAPEHPFPAAIDDAVYAYQWLLDHGSDPSKTVLAGDSAGAGLAVSTAIALRDRHLPMCAGIVALSPWADLTCSGESVTSRAAADIECTRSGLLEMAGSYMDGADPSQPPASPVFADFAGLPPLLCIVGGDEILLDDSIRLVRNAGTAGVDAMLFIAAGMQHVFPIWAGAFPEADAAIALIGNWVRAR